MSNLHRITVLGREISVRSTADEETVRKIESFVNDRTNQVLSSSNTNDSHLAVMLAFLNVVEEYLAVVERFKESSTVDNRRVSLLIQRLNVAVD